MSEDIQRLGLFCAEPHPMRADLLCALLSGHGGRHRADDGTGWDDAWIVGVAS